MLKNFGVRHIYKYSIILSAATLILLSLVLLIAYLAYPVTPTAKARPTFSPYPDGKNFAFSITDDADSHQTEKLKPVYDLLTRLGIKSTIAVWSLDPVQEDNKTDIVAMSGMEQHFEGDSLQNTAYREFVVSLIENGHEIGMHTVSGGSDLRETTIRGYEEFKSIIGSYPNINIMHSNNLENIYWGSNVFTNPAGHWFFKNIIGTVYSKAQLPFGGEDQDSPYFWGDIVKEKTKYVRMWGTSEINTLAFNPNMPYHDPSKPYVNYWFSFSDGFMLRYFNDLISDENIQKLVEQRGASIVYTHFAGGFAKKDSSGIYKVDTRFQNQMEKLSKQKDPWFVTTSTLLDRLLLMKKISIADTKEAIYVLNSNESSVRGFTLLTKPLINLYSKDDKIYTANNEGEIIIDEISAGESIVLRKSADTIIVNHKFPEKNRQHNNQIGFLENANLILGRILILLFSHSG